MMPDFTIFKISQLTTATASILGSAYIWVNVKGTEGLFFMIFGLFFTIILRYVEQSIFQENISHNRYASHNY